MLAKAMAVDWGRWHRGKRGRPEHHSDAVKAAVLDMGDMEAREAALRSDARIGTPEDIAAMVAFLAYR